MGFIGTAFAFMVGVSAGVYMTQNYDVPNLKKQSFCALHRAKMMEQAYRKQKINTPDDNNNDQVIQQ